MSAYTNNGRRIPAAYDLDPAMAIAAGLLSGNPANNSGAFANVPNGNRAITPPSVYDGPGTAWTGSGWNGTVPPSDVTGRAAPGGLAGQLGTQNADPTRNVGRNPDGSLVPVNTNPYNWGNGGNGTPGQTAYSSAAGTGAQRLADGSYRLPSGEVLPASASSTVNINGKQISIPGYYDPSKDAGIFQNGTTAESAMGRLTRRLKDDAANGQDPSDPNVIYREMARIRDEAGANGAQTGFVHLDRFVRGANGETGFQNAQGQHDQAWQAAIQNVTSTPPPAPPPATGTPPASNTTQTPGAPPVSAQTTQQTSPGMGSGAVAGANAAAAAQTGQPAGGPSFYGQAPGMIASSPDLAYRALIEKMGIDPTVHGQFTEYLKSRLGGATQAILNSMRSNGQLPGDINTALAQIGQQAFGQGGNWMDYTGQIADNALKNVGNAYGANASAQTVESYIQSLLGLKSEGLNPVAASGLSNGFNDTVGAYTDAALQNGGVDKSNFLPYFMKTQLYNKLVPGAQP